MYHEWINPGKYPSRHSARLIKECEEHIPVFTQTGNGGNTMAKSTRKKLQQHEQQHI